MVDPARYYSAPTIFVGADELFTHRVGVPASCIRTRGPRQWFVPPGTQCDAVRSGLRTADRPSRRRASGVFCIAAGRRTLPARDSTDIPGLYHNTSQGMGLWTQPTHIGTACNYEYTRHGTPGLNKYVSFCCEKSQIERN